MVLLKDLLDSPGLFVKMFLDESACLSFIIEHLKDLALSRTPHSAENFLHSESGDLLN